MEQIQIIDSKNHVGETVTIGAWVANKRSSGKIAFLQLRDGTAFFQGVVVKSEVPEEVFQTAKNLHQETSVLVTGEIREDSRSKFGYEIGITNVEVVSESHDYPITPKEHGTDFLMDHRHLWYVLQDNMRSCKSEMKSFVQRMNSLINIILSKSIRRS